MILALIETFFVCPGWSNRIPWTKWLINNRNLFLTVREAGKSKIKVLAGSVSAEGPLPGSYNRLLVPLHGGRGKGALCDLFYEDTKPIH